MKPRSSEHLVRLADGRLAAVRPIGPADRAAFLAFHAGLSDESRYLRYFSARRKLAERDLEHFTRVDQHDHAGVVALVDGQIVGHALYDRLGARDEAEVALEVADAWHGHGIGTALLEELARIARAAGIHRGIAHVLPTNQKMLQVFRDLGFEERARFEDGVVCVEMDLTATRRFVAARRERARAALRRRDPPPAQ